MYSFIYNLTCANLVNFLKLIETSQVLSVEHRQDEICKPVKLIWQKLSSKFRMVSVESNTFRLFYCRVIRKNDKSFSGVLLQMFSEVMCTLLCNIVAIYH